MAKTNASPIKYMLVELHVKDEHHVEFVRRMPEIIRMITERYQWELIYAAYPLSGQVNKFVHIWKLLDEKEVLQLMVDGAFDNAEEREGDSPDAEDKAHFSLAYRALQRLIDKTRHVFMTSLPHDPSQLGEQFQTLVIGADQKTAIFEHKELDNPANNITSFDSANVPAGLDVYLREGVVCGKFGNDLFFNLAQVKPISVFQAKRLERKEGITRVGLPDDSGNAGQSAVYLGATNGRVYKLDQAAFDKILQPIPDNEATKTTALLKPLIEGEVPLASIPTPRKVAIGEGCLCFVINLNSFV